MNSSGGVNTTRQKSNQNIQVYVRLRPINAREKGIRSHEVVEVAHPKEIIVRHPPDSKMTKKFTFDKTFGPDSNQTEVYHAVVAPLIEEVLAGYNCTVFAYGQTGTGKTHTMIGTECPELKSSWDDHSMIGIIPRALSHLFDELRMMELEFSMRISYLELYNEELCDLLSSDDGTKIRIFDDANKKGSVIIQGLEEIPVHSKDDVYKLLEKGKERRKTATTLMNAQSSRSHTVFSILVHIKENGIDGEEMLKIGKLNLVDLAGSENISKAGNEKGIRSRETVNINQSLLTLGRVITALVERTPHIPYRESKLTRLLQESLGGRTKTSIIATISPGHKDLEETLSTLEYAHRAKNIQNRPELNQKLTKKTVLKEYTEEIDKLKRDLMAARDKNGIYLAEETYNDLQYKLDSQNKELTEKILLIKALKDDLASKERIFNEVSLHLVEKSEELQKKDKFLLDTRSELDQTKKVLHTTKKRYKEKKVLLDTHVKTEKVLTSQATKLMEVAEIATTDTFQLHSSLERRKDIEVKNQTAFQQLSGNMRNTFEMMNQNLESFSKEHNSHAEIMKEEISNSIKLHKEFATTTVEKIQHISKNHNSSAEDFSSCIEKYSTELDDSYVIHKTAFSSIINELEKKEDERRSTIEKQLTDIKNLIQNQNSLLEDTFSRIIQVTAINSKTHMEYSSQAQERLLAIAKYVNDKLEEKQTNLMSNIKSMESIGMERKQMLQDLAQFHTNFMQKMEHLQNQETLETENIKEISEFQSIREPFTADVDIEIQSVDKFIDHVENEFKEQTNILTTFRQETNSLTTDGLENINKTQTIILEGKVENKEKLKDLLESVENYGENARTMGATHRQDVKSMKEKSIKEMNIECEQARELISEGCMQMNQFNTQNMALTTSLQTSVKDYSINNKRHMSDCNLYMENFHNTELKTYSPTGQTPSKKEFSYPRILAATSPHNLIIKRFRHENEWSDLDTSASTTIIEDSESTVNDLSDNSILINSTPIKMDKDENIKQLQPQNSFKIPQILKSENIVSSRKNSPALFFSKENKENCT